MLACLSFTEKTTWQKHREQTNHRVYQIESHGSLGGLKAAKHPLQTPANSHRDTGLHRRAGGTQGHGQRSL